MRERDSQQDKNSEYAIFVTNHYSKKILRAATRHFAQTLENMLENFVFG